MRSEILVALLALTGCAADRASTCDGAGLHVHVDLSGTNCGPLLYDSQNEETITATLATGDPLTRFNTHAHSVTTDPPAHDFVWTWPAGTTDGFGGTITWTGQLEAHRGSAQAPYTVDTSTCVDVTLVPTCGYYFVDAGAAAP